MKLRSIVISSFILFSSFNLFAADPKSELPKIWQDRMLHEEDLSRLAALDHAVGVIISARANFPYYDPTKPLHYRARTNCQYGAFIGFGKFLQSTRAKIHDEAVKNELTQLEERVKKISKDHKPYAILWPNRESGCRVIDNDLNALYSSVKGDLNSIYLNKKLKLDKDHPDLFLKNLLETKQADLEEKTQIPLGKLLEDYFINFKRDLIRITGMPKNSPIYGKMKQSLDVQVKLLKQRFEDSDVAEAMGPEKIAQYWFSLNVTEPKNCKGSGPFNKKCYLKAFITLTVALLPAYESFKSEEFKFEFSNESEFTRNDTTKLANAIYKMMFERIPQLKKSVYSKANLFENQQLLYGLVAPVLKKHSLEGLALVDEISHGIAEVAVDAGAVD